jgi:alpha-L-arabinofuranosidase
MRRLSLHALSLAPLFLLMQQLPIPSPVAGTIVVDVAAPAARIPASLYGIFFEEINHAGDGGLYAELIRNRGFEDARLPPMCKLENGFIVPPRTPHFDTGRPSDWRLRWDVTGETPGWSLAMSDGAVAEMRLVDVSPLTAASPHSVQVDVSSLGQGGTAALTNSGFWGINVVRDAQYHLTFHIRSDGRFRGPLVAALQSNSGVILASQLITTRLSREWQKIEATLTATASDPKGTFALRFGSTGRVWLDFVSLFPAETWRGRRNGLRPDLAELIAAMKPAFVRWPGGCFAEGLTIESRPQWKASLGRLEDRQGTYSPWGYWSSDGFGYHEFLQFSEDLGAAALLVVNAGVSCSFRSGTYLEDSALPELIQDTLDAIEYAIGPATSTWGALRAKHGHPEPFPLKYVEIGNEQRGARYAQRVAAFRNAIKEKYPQMPVALSSWIAGIDQALIESAGPIDIVDEHAYKPLHWAIEHFDNFAAYKRQGWDLYIGEFATNAGVGRGNVLAMLNDAVYMMSMEKSSDLVKMASYAPLLENVNHRDWPVNLIHFDSSRAYGRASYYAAVLFAQNRPSVNLATTVTAPPLKPRPITAHVGLATHDTAAEFKELLLEANGTVLYRSNFAAGAAGWTPEGRGEWSAEEGAYRQSRPVVAKSFLEGVAASAENVTVSVKARKITGAEGFIIHVGIADGRRVQWNVGGWGNRRHAVQVADAVVGEFTPGTIETGRWYDIRIEVRDRTVRGFLDGQLVQERTLPRVDRVLAIAGRDESTGDIVIKVVNSAPEPASLGIEIKGAPRISGGTVTVLGSDDPLDENTFDTPTKIAPKTTLLPASAATFSHSFPAYSLTIVRLRTK